MDRPSRTGRRSCGSVSLVGAGPGDPDLLTRKAARRLADADIVLYDALVSPGALLLAGRAQCFCVGKRAGRRSVRQATIHQLMIRAARRGKKVVRLKGGDPFVLGRGGEEALALAAAGIPFEVVPGVTSALAAPALAGIPVTHRGLATAFLVVAGHDERIFAPILETLVPHSMTLVVLMGLRSRRRLAEVLLARGWAPSTPAAILLAASTVHEQRWIGTLASLGQASLLDHPDAPGTLVIGEVVSLSRTLSPEVSAVTRRTDVGA